MDADPVEQAAPRAGLEAHQARHRDPPGALAGHPDHRGPAAGRPGPRLRRAQVLPGLVLKAHVRPSPPLDRQVTARRAAIASSSRSAARCTGTCGEKPSRCSRKRRPPSVPADMEQPPDQSGDPFQGPPLVLSPARYRRAGFQRGPQPLQLRPARHAAPPGPRDASAASRRPASAAATRTPNYMRPAAAGPPPAA